MLLLQYAVSILSNKNIILIKLITQFNSIYIISLLNLIASDFKKVCFQITKYCWQNLTVLAEKTIQFVCIIIYCKFVLVIDHVMDVKEISIMTRVFGVC